MLVHVHSDPWMYNVNLSRMRRIGAENKKIETNRTTDSFNFKKYEDVGWFEESENKEVVDIDYNVVSLLSPWYAYYWNAVNCISSMTISLDRKILQPENIDLLSSLGWWWAVCFLFWTVERDFAKCTACSKWDWGEGVRYCLEWNRISICREKWSREAFSYLRSNMQVK